MRASGAGVGGSRRSMSCVRPGRPRSLESVDADPIQIDLRQKRDNRRCLNALKSGYLRHPPDALRSLWAAQCNTDGWVVVFCWSMVVPTFAMVCGSITSTTGSLVCNQLLFSGCSTPQFAPPLRPPRLTEIASLGRASVTLGQDYNKEEQRRASTRCFSDQAIKLKKENYDG